MTRSNQLRERADRPLIITVDAPEWDIASCEAFEELLIPAHDHPDVVIDLSNVSFMDSSCLHKIANVFRERVVKRGLRPARLVIAKSPVRRLFQIVRFNRIWPIYATLEEALRAGPAIQAS